MFKVGFFKRGVTAAFFRESGMWLIESDLFIIDVIDGRRAGRICLIILVGIGSKQHDFKFPFKMSFDTSDSESHDLCSRIQHDFISATKICKANWELLVYT